MSIVKKYNYILSISLVSVLSACGGGSSDAETVDAGSDEEQSSENTDLLTGMFVDSAVEGASYTTETQSGVTNGAGEFSYLQGENVTFSIGAIVFPSIPAAAQVSPVDMSSGSSNSTATVTNIARLLQSLDEDGDPDNGITIASNAAVIASPLNFDIGVDEFENNVDVINLVSNSGSATLALVSEVDAISHLESVLDTEVSPVNGSAQTDLVFTTDMLVGRTLIPFPISDALVKNYSICQFNSSNAVYVVGIPGGELSDAVFPWTLSTDGVVAIDFNDFESGSINTLEIESTDGDIVSVQASWRGVPDPLRTYVLSKPLTVSDIAGRTISVQSAGGTGTIDFSVNGEFELSNSSGDMQIGSYSQHPVDGIIAGDLSSSYSQYILASGTLDDGFIVKSDFGGNDNFASDAVLNVDFFQTNGNNWTALHSVAR